MFRNSWSCSHRGLERRSKEIFTADLDIAVREVKSSVSSQRAGFHGLLSVP